MAEEYCGVLADSRGVMGRGCVVVEDGVIAGVRLGVRGYHDYGDSIVAPGFIDLHVHLRGMRQSYKEDENTGTLAAARAGITLVADMPNTVPRLDTPARVMEKLGSFTRPAVDYMVYAAVPENRSLVGELARMPVAGFKVYPEDLEKHDSVLDAVLSHGGLVVLHPELPWVESYSEAPSSREAGRPCWSEGAAVEMLPEPAGGTRVHVTHASCPSTIARAKRRGFTVDVTPHHLLWTVDDRMGCLHKVNPMLRGHAESYRLQVLAAEGMVDALASDHAPHAPWEKTDPLWCMPGIPWLEHWPWAVYRLVKAGLLSLERFLYMVSTGPARILGLGGRLGLLEPGYRANLTVFNPRATWRFEGPRHSKARLWPSLMTVQAGAPVATIVGGVLVYENGEPTGEAPGVNLAGTT